MREYRETFDGATEKVLDKGRDAIISVDNLANQARQAIMSALGVATYSVDSVLHTIVNLDIDTLSNFNDKNYALMMRLMNVNLLQTSTTLGTVGTSVVDKGDSTSITSAATPYSYTAGLNYTEEFAKTEPASSESNVNTTRYQDKGHQSYNYENHGQLYNGLAYPLYPDELGTLNATNRPNEGTGAYFGTWNLDGNRDSILWKTRRLCADRKFNTLISRFGTRADADANSIPIKGEVGHPTYGMSRGRNLLTKEAERGVSTNGYLTNGYNNPYCRVWTHHHQYDQVRRLIRPFTDENDEALSLEDWHRQMPFRAKGVDDYTEGSDVGFDKSVLQSNGFVNITPKFRVNGNDGARDNIHTKQCMFSIENLAWRDYSPYEFEQNLSWEQRGPLGGRIMWFPPYGLSFNETSQVRWNSHTFIGRGEDVYTYVNTTRRGSLSFMMVVDNPSIINYFKSRNNTENGDVQDTDILRFFAGCDPFTNSNNQALSSDDAPPNINVYRLHDEYTQPTLSAILQEKPKPDPNVPSSDDPSAPQARQIQFNVYFPNNYSGYYDRMGFTRQVDPILYLLQGWGAQQSNKVDNEDVTVYRLTRDNPTENAGRGYEMNSGGLSGLNTSKPQAIPPSFKVNGKTYSYRIDGMMLESKKVGQSKNSTAIENTYYQNSNTCEDIDSYSLNLAVSAQADGSATAETSKAWYSLAEVAKLLYSNDGVKVEDLINCGDIDLSSDRLNELNNLLGSNYANVDKIVVTGGATNIGVGNYTALRNKHLATARANTVAEWLRSFKGLEDKVSVDSQPQIQDVDKGQHPSMSRDAKQKRYSSVVITIKSTQDQPVAATQPAEAAEAEHSIDVNASTSDDDASSDENEYEVVGYTVDKETRQRDADKHNKRYDKEYFFFNKIKETDPIVWDKLMDKIQYFDPAFHSMTPEGFTDRLSFLHQCTRQGDTVGASDSKAQTANNLAFGRPPFCVLRIGDFYNTKILIENVTINYDPLHWDLNAEGIGVQPLLANVTLSIVFIGGSDIGGPIDRLQNAMSFNYYANQRFYDNRADRVKYAHNDDYTNFGGIESYEAHNTTTWLKTDQERYMAAQEETQSQLRKAVADSIAGEVEELRISEKLAKEKKGSSILDDINKDTADSGSI